MPAPYWSIRAEFEIGSSTYVAEYERRIEKKAEADAILESCRAKTGEVKKIDTRIWRQMPPAPFNLGSLQAEAYSLFGYTPRVTGSIAEGLYLEALISYPRTSSQKLPSTINYKAIFDGLSKEATYRRFASILLQKERLRPNEGKKEDPAHPAIYPTGNLPKKPLSIGEKKVWDIIVRRFMSVFGEPAVKQNMKISVHVGDHDFTLRCRRVLKDGWMLFYRLYVRTEEALLPPLKEGDRIQLKRGD